MSEFTAEDFAQVYLATRGEHEVALRVDSEVWLPWRVRFGADAGGWRSDEGMAAEGWVPVVEAGTITLGGLREAWEAAEVADECREGDVLVIRDDEDNYLVRRMEDRNRLDSTARILSRAPREPWHDLADVIREYTYESEPEALAQALYRGGVRVTGGDES